MTAATVELVAAAYVHGIDGARLLTTSDPAERMTLAAVTRRAVEMRHELDDRLAVLTINRLAQALNPGEAQHE